MTWDAKDLRKNETPVPRELLDEKGVGDKEVGEKTPYNELLEELWAPYMAGMDAPLVQGNIPHEVRLMMRDAGHLTDQQLAFKRRLYMRGTTPGTGLFDPSMYATDPDEDVR